jgi:hypothetical protein
MMPPRLGEMFTMGEGAALYVVATEIKRRGKCDLYLDQIAAFAGVGRSTAKNALRMAKRLGLIEIAEWKQAPDWNGPNRIRIVSKEWLTWLAHGRQQMTVKNLTTTTNQYLNSRNFPRGERSQRSYPTRNRGGQVP